MKLPNAARAFVDVSKLLDYCLNPNHEEGQHKARVFQRALGIGRTDAAWLKQCLLDAAVSERASFLAQTKFGTLPICSGLPTDDAAGFGDGS